MDWIEARVSKQDIDFYETDHEKKGLESERQRKKKQTQHALCTELCAGGENREMKKMITQV